MNNQLTPEQTIEAINRNRGKEVKLEDLPEKTDKQESLLDKFKRVIGNPSLDILNQIISSPFQLIGEGGFRNKHKTLFIASDGTIRPVTLADADAPNNSIYYSSTASKLVYKNSAGSVNALY